MHKKHFALAMLAVTVLLSITYFIKSTGSNELPQSISSVPMHKLSIGGQNGKLNRPLSVAVSRTGRIYVSDSGNHQVKVFESTGKYLFAFGAAGKGLGQFNTPYGIGVKQDGSVLVSDMLNFRIQHFSKDGKFLGLFLPETQRVKPGVLTVVNNEVYVSDLASHQIVVLSEQGTEVQRYSGSLNFPQGIAKAGETIYVADAGNNLIRKFTEGETQSGNNSLGDKNKFQLLRGIAIDNLNRILAVDSMASRVVFLTNNGEILFSIGSPGYGDDQLMYPAGIAIDSRGRIYVADWANNRVQVWGY